MVFLVPLQRLYVLFRIVIWVLSFLGSFSVSIMFLYWNFEPFVPFCLRAEYFIPIGFNNDKIIDK